MDPAWNIFRWRGGTGAVIIRAMSELLQCIEQEPASGAPADAAVIWMHGLGATAHDFETVPPELGLDHLAIRYVFPQAPSQPVTVNMGMVMPAWYDILSLGPGADGRDQDEAGIRKSEARIRALIDREVERGIAPERIVVAGFSQGGAMALQTGLRHPRRLGGLMVLSAYLLLAEKLEAEASDANRPAEDRPAEDRPGVPIFMAHGLYDPMVPHAKAEASRQHLEKLGWAVEWHEYPMQHNVCFEEIQAIGKWLGRVLGPS
jgi:phospholipase/carboxylesterase